MMRACLCGARPSRVSIILKQLLPFFPAVRAILGKLSQITKQNVQNLAKDKRAWQPIGLLY